VNRAKGRLMTGLGLGSNSILIRGLEGSRQGDRCPLTWRGVDLHSTHQVLQTLLHVEKTQTSLWIGGPIQDGRIETDPIVFHDHLDLMGDAPARHGSQ
jgi:hypothetical protein